MVIGLYFWVTWPKAVSAKYLQQLLEKRSLSSAQPAPIYAGEMGELQCFKLAGTHFYEPAYTYCVPKKQINIKATVKEGDFIGFQDLSFIAE